MSNYISNSDDIIDSRDIIERIEELESEQEDILSNGEITESDMKTWDDSEGRELGALRELAKQCEQYSDDWEYGELLIRDTYFEDYCQELLEDCGDIPGDLPQYIVIDWGATARTIAQDYMSVDFNGQTYLMRC